MGVIYHYCSPEAFLSIAKNKKLWLSATNNMNDFFEGTWLSKALENVLSCNQTSDNKPMREEISRQFNVNNNIKYITCFSKKSDILSQWRAYAQNGEGVAIGFDEDVLGLDSGMALNHPDPKCSIKLNSVKYMSGNELSDMLINVLKESGIELLPEKEKLSSGMLMDLGTRLSYLSSVVKNSAFIEEQEKRIIYSPLIFGDGKDNSTKIFNPIGDMHYRISNGFLTSYFEFEFKSESVVEVVCGPKNKFSQYDIETFMGLNGLGLARTHRSAATYR
ncbi:hypothetical protein PEC730217_36700 [Pectobacterium carotovorum subsp. carotovorum]|uniref:DUF2971 domain-containing protein n=1 Tax=Pectobacterium versatile TaxID=2488639 RepID=UPI001F269D97|nr:DUF2971 domain-containing protein [Pectobacterium versatile]GKW34890.1 hypothetical protein PEC730217_36700 [Pectobacterium carotovorum subsp. carotovorum]